MIREIKFRAWLILQKKMVVINNELYIKHFSDNTHYIDSGTIEGDALSPKLEFTLMQYIGLIDKNGIEIFEGDIINIKDNNTCISNKLVVKYDLNICCYTVLPFLMFKKTTQKNYTFEIIGNIYENPELLK